MKNLEATFTLNRGPGYWQFIEDLAKDFQRAQDEDGGMHNVGVQLLVGYEEGRIAIDDIMVPLS